MTHANMTADEALMHIATALGWVLLAFCAVYVIFFVIEFFDKSPKRQGRFMTEGLENQLLVRRHYEPWFPVKDRKK